ncbi:hypothetical protein GGI12_005277, partial [Dipsacomyces acuminosporus]
SSSTISHFNVIEGKKKKGRKITLGISNETFLIDANDDTAPPKRYSMKDVARCSSKKSVIDVEIGGYEPAAFDFLCASNTEAERITDAINAARRGMFVGDRNLDDAPPPPLPPKDSYASLLQSEKSLPIATPPPPPLPPPVPQVTHVLNSQEFALVLYDFSSDDPEELAVSEGDRVLILDKSDPEWWQVQLSPPDGRAGLVPATYVELEPEIQTDDVDPTPPLPVRTDSVRRAASQAQATQQQQRQTRDINPVPVIGSTQGDAGTLSNLRRQKTTDSDNIPLNLLKKRQEPEPGPDMSKVRVWTDKTGAYTVEAQLLSLDAEDRVHLHKTNNAKIIVPLSKFSDADRAYVNGVIGVETAPTKPAKSMTARQRQQENAKQTPGKRMINYDWDWFDFFTLKGGVSADNALKYATSFVAERLDDKSIPEITRETMQQLGVKPDDI